MKNETFEKTTRKPVNIIFGGIMLILVILIYTMYTNQEETKKVTSVDSVFSICWKEFVRVMDENYSYAIANLTNDEFTTIQGFVKDTDLENAEITFYDAFINVEEYTNGNRTHTIKAENVVEMDVYKNDRLMKTIRTRKK